MRYPQEKPVIFRDVIKVKYFKFETIMNIVLKFMCHSDPSKLKKLVLFNDNNYKYLL